MIIQQRSFYKKFALILFFYTLLVILWGAWVRISHSGDGCGDTWPLCHGQIIPTAQQGKTWVEFAHRLMSGLYGFAVIYFYWSARQLFPVQHLARRAAFWVLIFMITEALLGAKLVLFKLVGANDTPYRALVMALHQVNSLLLSGAITLSWVSVEEEELAPSSFWQDRNYYFPLLFFLIAISGAWASLATTLFPSENLFQGFFADFSANSHYLVRLRGLHPLIAFLVGSYFATFFWVKSQKAKTILLQKSAAQASFILLIGMAFGVSTLLALSPVWMKITHLALAHLIWFCLLRFIYAWRQERKGEVANL